MATPGNMLSKPSSKPCPPSVKSVRAGQVKFRSVDPRVSVIICKGTSSTENRVESEFGASNFTTSNAKQRRLLFSSKVPASKIPPVRLPRSSPAKLLTVPVFPPMLEIHEFRHEEVGKGVERNLRAELGIFKGP